MNPYQMAWLPDGWHYGSPEHIDSEDCMANRLRYCRVSATLWSAGERVRCVMGVGNSPEQAEAACRQNVAREEAKES